MSYSNNRFLRQLEEPSYEREYEEEIPEETSYSSNRFLKQLEDQEEKPSRLETTGRNIQNLPQTLASGANKAARLGTQGAIGAAKGALYTSPAAVPALLGESAIPGAIEQSLLEEISSEREMPASIKKAIGFTSPEGESDISYKIAKKASNEALAKATGGKGITGRLVQAPFELAGIETNPETGTEAATQTVAELITAFGGPKAFTSLVFEHLPKSFKNYFNNKHDALERMLIGDEPLPKSVYESQQKALKELQAQEKSELSRQIPPSLPSISSGDGKSLTGRVTPSTKDLGLRPISNKPPKNLEEDIGSIFSPTSFKNTTEGGKSLKNEVMKLDQASYRNVNNLYKKSRELNAAIDEIHPNLAHSLLDRMQELKKIPEPSGPQKQLITALENILSDVAEIQGDQILGFKPINNQILIDQVQSLRQKIDYDFTHGNAKNIFKPTINDLQEAARTAAEHAGNKEALTSFDEARAAYKDWADTFDNDYLRPIRNVQNRDYSKMFKGSLDVDEFNELNKILQKSPEGEQISSALKRDLVNKYLAKYEGKPISSSMKDFDKDLKELGAVITPEEATSVRNKFLESKKTQPYSFKGTAIEKQAAKYLNYTKPEEIGKLFSTRSGIKELRKDLGKSENGKEIFNTLKKQKIRDVLRENSIEKEFTGSDLYTTLNKRDNFEILSELIGESETEAARLAAKELGKKKMTMENATKLGEHVLSLKFLKHIIPLL